MANTLHWPRLSIEYLIQGLCFRIVHTVDYIQLLLHSVEDLM